MIFENIRLARPADFAYRDLTTATRTGSPRWVGPDRLEIPFDPELTAEEAEAMRLRLTTADPVEEEERRQAKAAYRANRDYLAVAAPTAAEVRDQVAALTRQVNALIRRTVER